MNESNAYYIFISRFFCTLAAVDFYLTGLKTAVIIQHFAVTKVMFSFRLSSVISSSQQ